ncbi:MAG: hypothetical protein CME62_10895 [Halobacteriovoraceae bacterium]|nr:hypothetical protein [Halobacteriovoraceae bacterium]|tara:strand:+ start:5789 stop:6748 length:960 start_codon:yes stop_codon:yes gene_type:complete
MAHIFFIDPLEKLNIKKDSTLMMALSFQAKGIKSYLLFEKDFSISNLGEAELVLYEFSGEFKEDGYYLNQVELGREIRYQLQREDVLHMRVDPPYDTRYQRYLWMLDFLQHRVGLEVCNPPLKIMQYNEKLVAFRDLAHSHPSFVGSSLTEFRLFLDKLKAQGVEELILKPLDLYSGIGVEKCAIDSNLEKKFLNKVEAFHGAIVAQPFVKDVYQGELRSIYFDGQELGTIIKTPNAGEYLANIAQGAQFKEFRLEGELKNICDEIAQELYEDDVRFIAFDLLGGKINEINITCPGLMVEVSYACKKNLCDLIADAYLN